MAALSAGLEATIHEWFSGGGAVTAVETSDHVDLSAAREAAAHERKRRHRPGEAITGEEAATDEAAEAVVAEPEATLAEAVEQPAPAVEEPTPVPVAEEPQFEPVAPVQEEVSEPVVEAVAEPVAAQTPVAEPQEPEAPAEPAEKPTMQQGAQLQQPMSAKKPPVKPAGPQVVPRPATLKGPRVVRFEGIKPSETYRRGPRPMPQQQQQQQQQPTGPTPASTGGRRGGTTFVSGEEEDDKKKGPGGVPAKKRSPRRRGARAAEPAEGLREWRDADLLERSVRLAAATGGTLRRHRAQVGQAHKDDVAGPDHIELSEPVTVKAFSAATGIKGSDIVRKLMGLGTMVTINHTLPRETVELLATEFGVPIMIKAEKTAENELVQIIASRKNSGELVSRAPIVTFLGHVDHGKTSLLDRIRNATVASSEEGGITQHMGAYRYDVGDKHVVFLDTPGHEAFTAMRARGANMTDVVVLVVAADDGVMPQTVEAINHAKAAKVPIVVALNKIDLPNANVQRALGQLAEHGLQPRQWGGNTEIIETSATTGKGMPELVETLSLEAELLELKADPTAPATGWVMESRLDPKAGILARLLVRDGTLHVGDILLCGASYGRVRNMVDARGQTLDEAGPATPIELSGLDSLPEAGDRFLVVDELSHAREVADERKSKAREQSRTVAPQATLQNLLAQIESGKASELNVVMKCDVNGSLEALRKTLAPLSTAEVRLNILHTAVGGITEGDVLLAEASKAIILGFRVVADQRSRILAEQKGVEIRNYMVIYHLVEDMEKALKGMLAPEKTEKVMGHATVREVFKVSRVGSVAGCIVTDGILARSNRIRIVRDGIVLEDNRQLDSLRRFKEDVRDVRTGLECGLKIGGYDDIKVGDVIEAFTSVEVAR